MKNCWNIQKGGIISQLSCLSCRTNIHTICEEDLWHEEEIYGLIHEPCMHPCTHLDLLGIGQNMFTTARFTISIDATKKFKSFDTGAHNLKHHKDVPHSIPVKDFLILTLHTLRASLVWPFISFLTFWSMHKMCSGPLKKISNFLNLRENHKLQKFSKGVFWYVTRSSTNHQMTFQSNYRPFVL